MGWLEDAKRWLFGEEEEEPRKKEPAGYEPPSTEDPLGYEPGPYPVLGSAATGGGKKSAPKQTRQQQAIPGWSPGKHPGKKGKKFPIGTALLIGGAMLLISKKGKRSAS